MATNVVVRGVAIGLAQRGELPEALCLVLSVLPHIKSPVIESNVSN